MATTNKQLDAKMDLILEALSQLNSVPATPSESDSAVYIVEESTRQVAQTSLVKVKLNGDWNEHKTGEIVEIDEALAVAFETCNPKMAERV